MSEAAPKSAEEAKLREHREKEIHFLQNFQGIIHQAKQELNNDLTRLAIKNMPMMMTSNQQQQSTQGYESQKELAGNSCRLSESSLNTDLGGQTPRADITIQELEPLDLEL